MFSGVNASLKSAGFGVGIALVDAGEFTPEFDMDGWVSPALGGGGTDASVVCDRKRPPRRGFEGDERREIWDEFSRGASLGVGVTECNGGTGDGCC
jgi:hypothetical protein